MRYWVAAIAEALFTTDTVTSEPSHIIRAVVIVAALAFAASGITYEVLRPSTKVDETEEAQNMNVNGNVQNLA